MNSTSDLFSLAVDHLRRAVKQNRHPFRFCHLVTYDTVRKCPESRIVVCREVSDDLTFTFYTDSRSPKVAQIQNHPECTVLFWHPGKQIQVRLRGICSIQLEGSGFYATHFTKVEQSKNISDYTSLHPPGSHVQETPESSPKKTANVHFAVITFYPHEMDVLQLQREGHHRIAASRADSQWEVRQIVP